MEKTVKNWKNWQKKHVIQNWLFCYVVFYSVLAVSDKIEPSSQQCARNSDILTSCVSAGISDVPAPGSRTTCSMRLNPDSSGILLHINSDGKIVRQIPIQVGNKGENVSSSVSNILFSLTTWQCTWCARRRSLCVNNLKTDWLSSAKFSLP